MTRSNTLSVATIDAPEFINLQPLDINPLMSKCEIKVLYVGENRNKSVISKSVATQMSKTLRGAPIVGYYIDKKEDFGDHGHQMVVDGEGIKFNTLTKPYGFVSPDSKVWFQKFQDTDEFGNTVIREYLMTEGYLWTEQFKECKAVLNNNNPQSMELHEKTLKGFWSKDENRGVKFFIINDAIFSKLCILGNDVEPCFEGANVSAPNISSNFSRDDDFNRTLFSMIEELKDTLSKGGYSMANNKLENEVVETEFEKQESTPIVEFEDGGDAAPAEGTPAPASEEPAEGDAPTEAPSADDENYPEVTVPEDVDPETYAPEGEGLKEALSKDASTNVPTKILENKKADDEEEEKDSKEESEDSKDSESKDKEDSKEDDGKDKEADDEEDKKKKNYQLEYEELQTKYAALEEEVQTLREFKLAIDNKAKDEMIDSFYMLSEEDKKEVIENKVNYSLDEIEAKLSVICVRKKVNFNLDDNKENDDAPMVYNLEQTESSSLPAWLKAVKDTRETINN